jgi:hypothetical protein
MGLLPLLYFIFGCYGVTSILVQSKLFKPFRKWLKTKSNFFGSLFNCMMCLGFWVGVLFVLLFNISPSAMFYTTYIWSDKPNLVNKILFVIFDGAFISGVVYYINIIELYIESKLPDEQ